LKTKIAGIIILVAVILAAGGYSLYTKNSAVTTLDGYLGGEKIGLFQDEEVASILKRKYHIEFDYSKAGSFDMVTADKTSRNYLFPSSQTALSYYKDLNGSTVRDEIIFNTPIVLYTHKSVADALTNQGIISVTNDVYYADMTKLVELIDSDASWADIGLPELYGKVSVDTTDPSKSNSGNMFAALLANVLNNGNTVDEASVDAILPKLKKIYGRLGYMETSSSDLFNQFLKMGVGAKPIIAGYESQLLEFAYENPDDYAQLKDDIIMVYPTPTVWSTHVYIALDDAGRAGIDALLDEEIQELAWTKHGFRTSSYKGASAPSAEHVADEVTKVTAMPEYAAMKKIIEALS